MPDTPAQDPAAALRAAFPESPLGEYEFGGETTLILAAERLPEAAALLKRSAGLTYNYLSDISAVDYAPVAGEPSFSALADAAEERPARFAVCYHLLSMPHARRLRLKVIRRRRREHPHAHAALARRQLARARDHGHDGHRFRRPPR